MIVNQAWRRQPRGVIPRETKALRRMTAHVKQLSQLISPVARLLQIPQPWMVLGARGSPSHRRHYRGGRVRAVCGHPLAWPIQPGVSCRRQLQTRDIELSRRQDGTCGTRHWQWKWSRLAPHVLVLITVSAPYHCRPDHDWPPLSLSF